MTLGGIIVAHATLVAGFAGMDPSVEIGQGSASKFTRFSNPEFVQILGYNDNQGHSNDAMEPFLSRDGKVLFFNSSNTASSTTLFWATKIDDLTFQYQGPIGGGVNTSGPLAAVASMDLNGIFYFITNRSYQNPNAPGFLATIYSGQYAAGAVPTVTPVEGLAAPRPGLVRFDAEISADGNTLYCTQGDFSTGAMTNSTVMVAKRHGAAFAVDPNSAEIMKAINDKHLNYATDTSADELELFFTRADPKEGPAIYGSERKSKSEAFGEPEKIEAITGFAEAPSMSPDGLSLYYHVRNAKGVFIINRVTRSANPKTKQAQASGARAEGQQGKRGLVA